MSTVKKIKPALTVAEWVPAPPFVGIIHKLGDEDKGREHAELWDWGVHITAEGSEGVNLFDGDRHAVAAMCLHGQPFGFTREELDHLKFVAEGTDWNGLLPILEKIEALLPPE